MNFLNPDLAVNYRSPSQRVRVMTEFWTWENVFCPSCWYQIIHHTNNRPVADFYCKSCSEDFELKSKKSINLWNIVPDWAYGTMIERLESSTNPSFFFLTYKQNLEISNFLVIPKFFIRSENIIKAPRVLKDRWEYLMCNISLLGIPESWKIFYIQDWKEIKKDIILDSWKKTCFLGNQKWETKWWLLDIIDCIEKLWKKDFSIDEMYNFKDLLKVKHPQNNFIEDKIRQQLQVLRDKWYLEFVRRGRYRVL